mgnify:CR=1 FL=1
MDESDKNTIVSKAEEIISWLDSHSDATKEEYDEKQKEIEGVSNPIMTKLYQSGAAGGGMPGGMPDMSGGMPDMGGDNGPTVEEVD